MRRTTITCITLAAGVTLAGCVSSESTTQPVARVPQSSASAPVSTPAQPGQVPTVPPEAGHLHGIGVNPADGRLYLGTHVGLMVVDDGAVRRVGDATVDLMGFAVAGPDHFVASGHPGAADDLPDPVGLIESTDGGLDWEPLSLSGRSDFHTLAAGAGRVYGFDGVLKSTDDGASWKDGDAGLRPASLAVHPQRPETVLATTEHGPVRSTDGGATFTHIDDAPVLLFLSWTSDDTVWGVAPDGSVHLSDDGGATWQSKGRTGEPPEAFTAVDGATAYVATAGGILHSGDSGGTFHVVARRG